MESTLHPQLLHLGTRHYRINPSRHSLSSALSVPVGELEELAGAGDAQCPKDSLEDTLDVTIEAEDNGFIGRLHVPAMFHRFVVGPRSTSLDQIQRDFSCKVILPHVDSGSEVILVKASVRSDVHNACRRIRWIQTNARSKTKPTHFISLPANYPELQKNFNRFRKTVLDSAEADGGPDFSGVNSDIFPRPASLHFTLVPLLLANESEVLQASSGLTCWWWYIPATLVIPIHTSRQYGRSTIDDRNPELKIAVCMSMLSAWQVGTEFCSTG
ncbi:hypothetical protein AHF37_12248 [Paragonimus kellicotti]|nr:hypothetical protein AHF37_12248 [Paragonimus kellicotti]